jgi:uncharacterized protein (TIGR03435 family)
MMLSTWLLIALAPCLAIEPGNALQDSPAIAFEVASVKIAVEPDRSPMFCIGPCTFGERMTVAGSRVDIRYMSLHQLIATAYRIKPYQLSDPDWLRSQRFDIAAKMPERASKAQVPEMLQALLVSKGGSKLRKSTADADAPVPETPGSRPLYSPNGEGRSFADGTLMLTGGAYGPIRGGRGATGGMKWEFQKLTMPALAELLTPHVDRPVLDMTNLKAAYYLSSTNHPPTDGGSRKSLEPSSASESGRPPDLFGEGLLAAIEKAGLKLESRRAPVETIAVDRIEKVPSGN